MTLHLVTDRPGADAHLDGGDHSTWANYQRGPGIQNGLAAVETTKNHTVHGDAERQWDKVDTRIT